MVWLVDSYSLLVQHQIAARPCFRLHSSLLRYHVLAHSGLVFDGLLLRFLSDADEGPRSNIRALAKNEIEIALLICFITRNPREVVTVCGLIRDAYQGFRAKRELCASHGRTK